MCCGLYPDINTAPPSSGHIKPGETPLQAAARRYYERQRLQSPTKEMSCVDSSDFGKNAQISHNAVDKSSRSSIDTSADTKPWLSDRWRKFKRHHLP